MLKASQETIARRRAPSGCRDFCGAQPTSPSRPPPSQDTTACCGVLSACIFRRDHALVSTPSAESHALPILPKVGMPTPPQATVTSRRVPPACCNSSMGPCSRLHRTAACGRAPPARTSRRRPRPRFHTRTSTCRHALLAHLFGRTAKPMSPLQ